MSTFQIAEQIFPVYRVENGCMVSLQGDLTVAYRLRLPEIFTLSDADFEQVHQAWINAVKVLPDRCIVHQQDYYHRRTVTRTGQDTDFLAGASGRHFEGRPYLAHSCYVMLTQMAADRREASSALSALMRSSIFPRQVTDPALLPAFLEKAGQFERILSESGLIGLTRMSDDELSGKASETGLLEQYCFLQSPGDRPVLKDIHLQDGLRVGDARLLLFTLGDARDLPAHCGSRITYDRYSTDRTAFPVGFASPMNLLLDCPHMVNQYLFTGEPAKAIKMMEARKLRLQSLSAYSRENSAGRDATDAFLHEAVSRGRNPVKAHINILAWTEDPGELPELKNRISAALAQTGACAKLETDGAPQIWWAGIPGNAAEFPMNDTFDTFPEQALCFFNRESHARSDSPASAVRFCDRLSGRPVYLDLYDLPRKKGLAANMGTLVCGTSGGGKSMTVNHLLHTQFTQGAYCVTVDIGGSYRGLCELVGGYYFTYEEQNPIRFNPFYIPPGQMLDTEKKESLKALLLTLWKQENEASGRSEYVALSDALQGYYQSLSDGPNLFPCFDTFYEYLQGDYARKLQSQKVRDKDFDLSHFLYVLRPYYAGGEFDYLLNARENLDVLEQRFVVIELDNIKDHPILFPVVTLIIMEMFLSKMRKLSGKRKVLTIDEAWKAIANSGMADFIKYAFKTMRKFNGIPIVVTQELDDLVSSPVIKDAIINNADIKILMDMRAYQHKFDKLQETLGLSEKGKTQVLSVNRDHREIFISIGGAHSRVVRNELAPEEYYAYTTEGTERVRVREYAQRYGGLAAGITRLIREKKRLWGSAPLTCAPRITY